MAEGPLRGKVQSSPGWQSYWHRHAITLGSFALARAWRCLTSTRPG